MLNSKLDSLTFTDNILRLATFNCVHILGVGLIVIIKGPLILRLVKPEPIRQVLVQTRVGFLHSGDGVPEEPERRSVRTDILPLLVLLRRHLHGRRRRGDNKHLLLLDGGPRRLGLAHRTLPRAQGQIQYRTWAAGTQGSSRTRTRTRRGRGSCAGVGVGVALGTGTGGNEDGEVAGLADDGGRRGLAGGHEREEGRECVQMQ